MAEANDIPNSELQKSLKSLDLKQEQVSFILDQGGKYLQKPHILSKKLEITEDIAIKALDILRSSKQDTQPELTKEEISKIRACLKKNSDVDSHEDIALLCDIDEILVSKYFELQTLNKKQQILIEEKYNKDISVADISVLLNIPINKVKEYIESTFVTFSDDEGGKVLDIIHKHFGDIPVSILRKKIRSKNLELQDQLCCIIKQKNSDEFTILENYFNKYEESKNFLDVDVDLTMDDIFIIEQSSKDSIEQLSVKLNKVESIISDYIHRSYIYHVEYDYFTKLQLNKIREIANSFEDISFSLEDYRTITTYSHDHLISCVDNSGSKKVKDLILNLLPLVFYYLKCSLPFEDIARIIANVSDITLTTHDVFHLIFQLSDPVLKGLCIEHYSFSNAVPLIYPKLSNKSTNVEFAFCKELWYCVGQYNGLISFGLGRAGWIPVGKSSLLDLIFETDFVKGSPQNSAFHFQSIDIQFTKNLFGDTNKSNIKPTSWAYIDCHGYSDLGLIDNMCRSFDVALIHVCHNETDRIEQALDMFRGKVKHLYIFLRDCEGKEIKVSVVETSKTIVSIPNLNRKDINFDSIVKSLKEIGYKILHADIEFPKLIGTLFFEEMISDDNKAHLLPIEIDKQLIDDITQLIDTSKNVDFSFLNYYPTFVAYMSSYHQASYETDQNTIDRLNKDCEELNEKLKNCSKGEIVMFFNDILKQKNSTLILWKLSRELSQLSGLAIQSGNKTDITKEHKNDKYTLEILWREALLSQRYEQNTDNQVNRFDKDLFASNFSKHVGSGEVFELIDGDNLRFFNKDIDSLLSEFYAKQNDWLNEINEGQTIKLKPAPIVVSIFGPQNSGKSTLLNYCFGCKFLTSAGRCTRGIYGSLSKLDRPVNLSQSFLILDTEGLDAIERNNIKDTSMIHFDRTMVLFCLSVSQVVIINVKGDIGSEMQNLLQICTYSLNRLKLSKVKAPKIFFVLNQQADPDPNKHLDSINLLMEKLNSDSGLMESEGVKISDLIQVSEENLFILPSAFNSQQMNKPGAKLFDSNVIKLSPTISFAEKCSSLRVAIMDQLDQMGIDDRAPFKTMSEWMEMAGVIWDTIIRYQDIVKYNNFEELICSNKLDKILSELMDEYIYSNQDKFMELTNTLCKEIRCIQSIIHPDIILTETMMKFDDFFMKYQDSCLRKFSTECEKDSFLKKMEYFCEEKSCNINRLIFAVRKQYEDQINLEIKSIFTELKLSESMRKFQISITENVDRYLGYSIEEQKTAFEKTWDETFGIEDTKEEERERDEAFSNLYTVFKLEYNAMENKQTIFQLFRKHDFRLDDIIAGIKEDFLRRCKSTGLTKSEQLIYPLHDHHVPIKEMLPYNGNPEYSYMCRDSLYEIENCDSKISIIPYKWIPSQCHSLLQFCSGLYNHPDIIWKVSETKQIDDLVSVLRCPDDLKTSIWERFIDDIARDVIDLSLETSYLFPVIVKRIVHALCFRIRLLNYEIGHIHACLSTTAERLLSEFVLSFVFFYIWTRNDQIREAHKVNRKAKKQDLHQFFDKKIESHKMIAARWNREKMAESDRDFSEKYALDYVSFVKCSLKNFQQQNLKNVVEDFCRKDSLSHENILAIAYDKVATELKKDPGKEVTDTENFVVQFICNRNEILQELFREKWTVLETKLYEIISQNVIESFSEKISKLQDVLNMLLLDLENKPENYAKGFDSDNFFEFENLDYTKIKEIPFKAMNNYLKNYLDPNVTPDDFRKYLLDVFEIDGIKLKMCKTYSLQCKRSEPILDEETFRKLVNTEMFNTTELIFNIFQYLKHFQATLGHRIQLDQDEFQEMIASLKNEFENNAIGCPSQCPSCGKFCEREIHPNDGKCQMKTGHQISSMGGKVWNADDKKTAVLFMCDDYKDHTKINLQCVSMKWGEFKDKCGNEWDWNLPTERNTDPNKSLIERT